VQTELLLSGISLGGVYGILALGLALILNIFGLANMGHGAIMVSGPLILICGLNLKAFGPLGYTSVLILALLLWFTWRFGFKVLSVEHSEGGSRRGSGILVMGLGLIKVVEELGAKLLPGGVIFLDYLSPEPGVIFNTPRVLAIALSVTICLLTRLFLKHTDTGRCILAVSQNPMAATIVGIKLKSINLIVFLYSVFLTVFSGVILASIVPLSPFWALELTIKALLIVGLARPFKITDIVLVSFGLGLFEVLISYYLGEEIRNLIIFATFIVILIYRSKLGLIYEKA